MLGYHRKPIRLINQYRLLTSVKVIDFEKIIFGKTSAEAEKDEYPELLIDGFIDDSGIINKLINRSLFLIYGQKGSGKSAIGSRMELLYKDSKTVTVKINTLDNFDYAKFAGFDSAKGVKEGMMNRSWESILMIALLDQLNNDPNLLSKTKFSKKVISELCKYEIIPSGNISSIMKKASKKTIINLKVLSHESEKTENDNNSYDNMHDNLEKALVDCIPSKKTLLLLDGLDSIMSGTERQYSVLSSLLHSVNYINKVLRDNDVDCKIIIFIRTDLMDKLFDPNKQKIIDDYGYELSWFNNIDELSKVNLIRLINIRTNLSLKTENEDLFSIFPKKVENKDIRKYILDNTRHLPRDIVRLMNEIQKNFNGVINQDLIRQSVKNYSSDYFYGEISDELKGLLTTTEIEQMFNVLKRLKNYSTDERELKKISEDLGYKLDFDKILPILFNSGAIGGIRVNPNKSNYFYFKYRERRSDYNPMDKIIIHLALQNALKVKTGSPIKLIDTDDE